MQCLDAVDEVPMHLPGIKVEPPALRFRPTVALPTLTNQANVCIFQWWAIPGTEGPRAIGVLGASKANLAEVRASTT